jgi:hypothetical protein
MRSPQVTTGRKAAVRLMLDSGKVILCATVTQKRHSSCVSSPGRKPIWLTYPPGRPIQRL